MKQRVSLFVAAMVLSLVALVSVASAATHFPVPDKSLGGTGQAALPFELPVPPGVRPKLSHLAATGSGAVYALAEQDGICVEFGCTSNLFLARFGSNGALATGFGGSGVVGVLQNSGHSVANALATDESGRALVLAQEGSTVTLRRYLASGALDPSFGSSGKAVVDCRCVGVPSGSSSSVSVDPKGRIVVEIANGTSFPSSRSVLLLRFSSDGAPDPSFGGNGSVLLPALQPPTETVAFSPGGAIYLSSSFSNPAVRRIAANGKLDTRFEQAAAHSIAAAKGFGKYGNRLLVDSNGRLDLFGWDFAKATLLQLRANGEPVAGFGRGGLKSIGNAEVTDALATAGGGALILTGDEQGNSVVTQLTGKGGRTDSFGSSGQFRIPGIAPNEGLSLAPVAKGRASILSLGAQGCRSYCPPLPQEVRYRVAPAQ